MIQETVELLKFGATVTLCGGGMAAGWSILARLLPDDVPEEKAEPEFLRGSKLLTVSQAQRKVIERFGVDYEGLYLANAIKLPLHTYYRHVLVVGSTGSGKGIVDQLFVKEVLRDPSLQLVAFDPDGSYFGGLKGYFGDSNRLLLFQPFDKRSSVADFFRDYRRLSHLENLVNYFIDLSKSMGGDQFWPLKARNVLRKAIGRLLRHKGRWAIRDVIESVRTIRRVVALLKGDGSALSALQDMTGPKKTAQGILGTIDSNLARLETFAAAQDDPDGRKRHFSTKWLLKPRQNPVHLVLVYSGLMREALKVCHGTLLEKVLDEVLTTGSPDHPVVFLLDEVALLGKDFARKILDVLPYARKYGLIVVATIQSPTVLEAAWGDEKLVNAFLGAFGTTVYLSQSCVIGRERASKDIGSAEIMDIDENYGTSHSVARGKETTVTSGTSSGINKRRTEKRNTMPDEHGNLGEPTPRMPWIEGYIRSSAFQGTCRFRSYFIEELADWAKPERGDFTIHPDDEFLKPWTREDVLRLKLPQATTDALFEVLLEEDLEP